MTNADFFLKIVICQGQKVMYQKKDLACTTKNTGILKLLAILKFQTDLHNDKKTEWQNYRHMNVQLVESTIKHLKRSIHFQNDVIVCVVVCQIFPVLFKII